MKTTLLTLILSTAIAAAQTSTATVDGNGTLVHPAPGAFAAANNLPTLSGNNSFAGQNDFESIRSGDLRFEQALDEVFSITVNGTASQLFQAEVEILTDFGNTISVIEDSGQYFWSDENSWWMFGRSPAWQTAEEGAAALRTVIPNFDPAWTGEYPYSTSGAGAVCTVAVTARDVPDWGSNNGTLLSITISQQGRSAAWIGSGALISPGGNITVSGALTSINAPADPPILAQKSDAFTDIGETGDATGLAISGSSSPLIGLWTSPGQNSMGLGFGGRPDTTGDNLGARPWTAVNSSYVGRILFLGSEGNWGIDTGPADVWQTQNWSAMRGWGFHYAGSIVGGQSMPGAFSTRSLILDNVEPSATNPGVYFWSSHSAVLWNADIGTNKREVRLKFFGAPANGYGNRAELATRVIASTEWAPSRWRGIGTADPDSPQDGDLFFRSDTSKIRIYAAGNWRDLN